MCRWGFYRQISGKMVVIMVQFDFREHFIDTFGKATDILDHYEDFQDAWWFSYGWIVCVYSYGPLYYIEETYSL